MSAIRALVTLSIIPLLYKNDLILWVMFSAVLTPFVLFSTAASSPVGVVEGGHSLHSFINSYQMMFCTLFALLAGTAIVIIGGSSHLSSSETDRGAEIFSL